MSMNMHCSPFGGMQAGQSQWSKQGVNLPFRQATMDTGMGFSPQQAAK